MSRQMSDREKLNAVPIVRGEGWQLVMVKDIPTEYRQLFLRAMIYRNYQIRNGEFGYFVHDWESWLDERFPCEETKKESP